MNRLETIGSDILSQIGKTPLLRIRKLHSSATTPCKADGLKKGVRVYAKLEMFNPGGSVKDRPALRMIEDGEKSGELTKDKTIIDSTSGNTGIAYAVIGVVKGYRVKLVMPQSVSRERKLTLETFRAEMVFTDAMEGSDGAQIECQRIYEQNKDLYFKPDQYNNDSNWKAHYDTTGPEIWEQTKGELTCFIATIGTSGTIVGTGRRLKQYNKDIRVIAVEPEEFHGIEGLKNMDANIVPGIYDESVFDEKIQIKTEDAYEMTRKLARIEGVMVGQSSGAALKVALDVASRIDDGVIVTVFPDGGDKYLSTKVWDFGKHNADQNR